MACEQTDSRTEAQKLIKSQSVSIRLDNCEDGWHKVPDHKFKMPTGEPFFLLVGKIGFRKVPHLTKFNLGFHNSCTLIMIPEPNQTDRWIWSEMWNQSKQNPRGEMYGFKSYSSREWQMDDPDELSWIERWMWYIDPVHSSLAEKAKIQPTGIL